MTPLRRRMIDAMVLRGFAARTQETYVSAVSLLARHHHRSPELLSDEQVRGYLLHLLQDELRSRSTVNITACAMRFLVCDVLGQAERRVQIALGKCAQRLPEVLSRAEVAALLEAPMSCKARTLLMTAYASGLRLNELCHLRVCDIDCSPGPNVHTRGQWQGRAGSLWLARRRAAGAVAAVLENVPLRCARRGLVVSCAQGCQPPTR